ncbi:mitochondrial carrier [Fistulina hepatica ATCC 64428]|uniref:Mitochondrial carrier n=1 Tax=Fistulina hepatica ATCC 64428 TaxID=1128425 RepID=A0A0D7AI77_9AGAR|nr:mitochondrial carrier [Fistulina hepatica ATCC 64428]
MATATPHTFDTIKTRIQCSPPGTYRGAMDVLRQIIRNEGFFALYKGATPPAVGWAAIDSLLMGSLHNYRLFFLRHGLSEPVLGDPGQQRLTLFGHGVAGLFAGCTSTILATPMEQLKVKLQLQAEKDVKLRQFSGPIDCARKIICLQGVFGLWSGFMGSVAMRTNFFWMFLSFEVFMRGFSKLQNTPYEVSTPAANFWSGGLASLVFWIMAIPADNVKNRMMAHPYPRPYSSQSLPIIRPSFVSVARQAYKAEGVSGLYRGLGTCIVRAFPANACALLVYESIMCATGAEKIR